jgi:cobalt-precorrin 5A hydrolase
MIVAGIGCRTGVSAEALLALISEATARIVTPGPEPRIDPSGSLNDVTAPQRVGPQVKPAGDGVVLAVPEFRRTEQGIAEAAAQLGLPILWIARAALRGEQGRCLTRSARAEAETGFACVAEAAALAGAGPGARLVLPRIARGGVTCALAQGSGP